MATVTAGISLSSTDLNNDSAGSSSEALGLSLSKALSVVGNHHTFAEATAAAGSSTVFLTAANWPKSYVLLYNTSTNTAETIRIELADDDNDFAILGAGEFAFFPWSATHDLRSESASGTPTMEVRVYQVTA